MAGEKICLELEEKFKCDNHLQCEDDKDEVGCEEVNRKKKILKNSHHYICKRPFLVITSEKKTTITPGNSSQREP